MLITRTSIKSGIERTLDIPVTQEQLNAWEAGAMIQRVMPELSESHREFLMTGMTDEEWNDAFPEEEEDLEIDEDIFDSDNIVDDDHIYRENIGYDPTDPKRDIE